EDEIIRGDPFPAGFRVRGRDDNRNVPQLSVRLQRADALAQSCSEVVGVEQDEIWGDGGSLCAEFFRGSDWHEAAPNPKHRRGFKGDEQIAFVGDEYGWHSPRVDPAAWPTLESRPIEPRQTTTAELGSQ